MIRAQVERHPVKIADRSEHNPMQSRRLNFHEYPETRMLQLREFGLNIFSEKILSPIGSRHGLVRFPDSWATALQRRAHSLL